MNARRAIGTLAFLGALSATVKGVTTRHRALAAVAPALRHPLLYLPLSISNALTLALGRRLPAFSGPSRPGIRVTQQTLPAKNGRAPVTVLAYEHPRRTGPSGALLWIHGGGTVMGSVKHGHAWCGRVADELGALVISVDYRLAPENPYPAALDDCYHALGWLHDNALDLGVDTARIAVGGESGGGGLAAALAQRAHDTNLPIRFQLLVYPMLDDRTVLQTPDHGRGVFAWTPTSNRFAWTAYLGHPPREHDDRPYVAAARRTDLTGLPSAWIGVGDLDLFHAENIDYARRLREAGTDCELHTEPGMYHLADALLEGKAATMTTFRNTMLDALRIALRKP
jgi:acetyl esterase/lipase